MDRLGQAMREQARTLKLAAAMLKDRRAFTQADVDDTAADLEEMAEELEARA